MEREKTPAERVRLAKKCWHEGDHAFRRGDYSAALRLYRGAHDLVVDLPRWHRLAHEKLCPLHRETGRWVAWTRDNVLLTSAPLGTFHLLAALTRAGRRVLGQRRVPE